MPSSSARRDAADHVQRDALDRAQRRRDDRQVMRVERNADPADHHRVANRRVAGRRRRQIAIARGVDRARHDLDVARAGLARMAREKIIAGDHGPGDAHHGVDLVAEQRAQPMALIAVEPGIVIVDDVRQALQPRDLDPGRQPGQRLLLQPDQVVAHAARERAKAPRVGHEQPPGADRRGAVERAHIVVVEQRLDVEVETLPLQLGEELKKAHAAARAEPFVACQQQDVDPIHRASIRTAAARNLPDHRSGAANNTDRSATPRPSGAAWRHIPARSAWPWRG